MTMDMARSRIRHIMKMLEVGRCMGKMVVKVTDPLANSRGQVIGQHRVRVTPIPVSSRTSQIHITLTTGRGQGQATTVSDQVTSRRTIDLCQGRRHTMRGSHDRATGKGKRTVTDLCHAKKKKIIDTDSNRPLTHDTEGILHRWIDSCREAVNESESAIDRHDTTTPCAIRVLSALRILQTAAETTTAPAHDLSRGAIITDSIDREIPEISNWHGVKNQDIMDKISSTLVMLLILQRTAIITQAITTRSTSGVSWINI